MCVGCVGYAGGVKDSKEQIEEPSSNSGCQRSFTEEKYECMSFL